MTKSRILYSSAAVHHQIKKLFTSPDRGDQRVALVAFVGGDGERYLPDPKGLRVICNPAAGGTNPNTLRSLRKRGAKVQVSDRLHMKVYWSKKRGCVITSANASRNALGRGGLKESGVFFPPGNVDIEKLIDYAKPEKLETRHLRRLDQASPQQRQWTQPASKNEKQCDFLEWYGLPSRSAWKIAWVYGYVSGTAKIVKSQTKSSYGVNEPSAWMPCRKNRVEQGDWLLCFYLGKKGATGASWVYVDFLAKINKEESDYYDRLYSYHAVQVHKLAYCASPPFELTMRFRKALRKAVNSYGEDKIKNASKDVPTKGFLDRIRAAYT